MNRPIEPRQHRDLLQEGQIPVRAALRLGIALGQVFVELGLGFFSAFVLLMRGVPSTPESIFNTVFSFMCYNVSWPHCEAVCKRISAFAVLCNRISFEFLIFVSLKAPESRGFGRYSGHS